MNTLSCPQPRFSKFITIEFVCRLDEVVDTSVVRSHLDLALEHLKKIFFKLNIQSTNCNSKFFLDLCRALAAAHGRLPKNFWNSNKFF